jgi:hypothetical protein
MIKYIYLIFILTLLSCSNIKNQREKEFLKSYAETLNEFNTDLTDHFPNTLNSFRQFNIAYPAGAHEIGMANLIFSHHVDTTEFNTVIRKLNLNKIEAYKPTDSIFIIIGDSLDYTKKINGIPIPSFESYERDFGLNSKYLTEFHKIYVLESKPGEFMNKEYLTSSKNLPEKWKNGFSRGIATNEKENELIYWLCVW